MTIKIAIDYDRTWNADSGAFYDVAKTFYDRGHTVYVVTARSATKDNIFEEKDIAAANLLDAEQTGIVQDVIYCDGVAKRWALHHYHDLDIDIWIDDKPQSILYNSTATKEILEEWRANGRV